MEPTNLTLFSWGYYGWGNDAKRIVELIDQTEEKRGFLPPLFVDIRLKRSVRAKDFSGNAFEQIVGKNRYKHLSDLGNLNYNKPGSQVRIKDPVAVATLLDLAEKMALKRRRVIYFCGCKEPRNRLR